jgi:hypothetical protein
MRTFRPVIVGILFLSACSPAWYYPHLDWLLPWYIRDYITLEQAQQSELEKRLGRQLEWHCRTQLPAYASFLRSMRHDFESPESTVSQEQFRVYYEMLQGFWRELMTSVAPDVADLLISASDRQIDELFQTIEADNQDLEEKYVDLPPEEIYQNRYDRMLERLAEWIGKINDDQKSAIWKWSNQLGIYGATWIAHRRALQQHFRELLAERARNPSFKARFAALLTAPEPLIEAAYRTQTAHRTALTLDLLTRIAASLTTEQRRHLLGYFTRLSDDFDRLACPARQEILTGREDAPH